VTSHFFNTAPLRGTGLHESEGWLTVGTPIIQPSIRTACAVQDTAPSPPVSHPLPDRPALAPAAPTPRDASRERPPGQGRIRPWTHHHDATGGHGARPSSTAPAATAQCPYRIRRIRRRRRWIEGVGSTPCVDQLPR
jgi:hypothetical protein